MPDWEDNMACFRVIKRNADELVLEWSGEAEYEHIKDDEIRSWFDECPLDEWFEAGVVRDWHTRTLKSVEIY